MFLIIFIKKLIIEFFSENCLLCCMLKKRIEELQKKYLNLVVFLKVDVKALPVIYFLKVLFLTFKKKKGFG